MGKYKVEWSEYNKKATEYKEEKDCEITDADSADEAIELIKQYIFDNTDHEEYPEMRITESGVDLGDIEYCRFTATEIAIRKITLTEYAKMHGINPATARQRAGRGLYTTAEKIGRDWFINPEEPHVDNRIKSGDYKNWRNKSTQNPSDERL